jgi:hypothetical protein
MIPTADVVRWILHYFADLIENCDYSTVDLGLFG